ncbi:MAG: DNA mismatch repair protein MutS [Methylovirgula sp.]|uniref:DNA mismatch repair protein MutS n=1 Tax=Methylovirgula sp. TaxID=1978224 RepID=UPI00307639C9
MQKRIIIDPAPAGKITPMMVQFIEIKAANPDCLLFYRMGDFYEMFFEDAEVASRALGIVLTHRGKHLGRDIPMCGVPIHRSDEYLARLIALGHRVAVCEQTEDPAEARKRGNQAVVRRAVTRLVTPGTITEESLLDPARANCLLAIVGLRDANATFGIASVDISTGAFAVTEVAAPALSAEIARLDASEIVAPEVLCGDADFSRLVTDMRIPLSPVGGAHDDPATAARRLEDYFGLATLDGLGNFSPTERLAAALAIFYIERTQRGARPALSLPSRMRFDAHMEIDAATRANLELTRTLSGHRDGALLEAIDRTVTPGGGRLLAERLAGPLTDVDAIQRRLDAVAFLRDDRGLRDDLRVCLKSAPDLPRPLSRLALQRSGPRDLAAIRDALQAAQTISARLQAIEGLPDDLREIAENASRADPAIAAHLAETLADELPLKARDGNFIQRGYDAELDELRGLRDESRRIIAELQARYAALAETKQLKLKHNNFLGFFIEVPQAQGEKLLKPPFNTTFVHRQTMTDAMRFSTTELAELEAKMSSAADRALARELGIFDKLSAQILDAEPVLKAVAEALATLDVAAALADLAELRGWTRPEIDTSLNFVIEAGRHPVVEAALAREGKPFVANDCNLSGSGSAPGVIAVITGPNMAGKSTYLRQNALIAALAQMGSFVPAKHCKIGIVDRLFSRVGAADDLARGRSTFMVEMVETAAILNQATERSLVILDEIGRGTATFDGLAIAWAVMEQLHGKNKSRALFATHFHELTHLAKQLSRVVNLTMRVADWKGDVVFLHEIIAGAADRSYGIQVAKLAGLPSAVVKRAQTLLAEFEAGDRRKTVKPIADLPLFAAAPPPPPVPVPSEVEEALDAIEPDELSPRDAQAALYKLKALLKKAE